MLLTSVSAAVRPGLSTARENSYGIFGMFGNGGVISGTFNHPGGNASTLFSS